LVLVVAAATITSAVISASPATATGVLASAAISLAGCVGGA
jgi:hypothetical protein